MYPEAYNDWLDIFSEDLSEIWQKERQELKKVAVLLSALQKEFKEVQTNVEMELQSIQQQLEYKDLLSTKNCLLPPNNKRKKKSPSPLDKENIFSDSKPITSDIVRRFCEQESPDIFGNSDLNVQHSSPEISVIDLSISDDNVSKTEGSPTIKRRRKRYKKNKIELPLFFYKNKTKFNTTDVPTIIVPKEDLVKANLFKTPHKSESDTSIIENSPNLRPKVKRPKAVNKFGASSAKNKSNKTNNTTLTQLYGRPDVRQTKNVQDDGDSDETFFENETEGTKMGITDLINYINADDTTIVKDVSLSDQRLYEKQNEYCPDLESSGNVDNFSKGDVINEPTYGDKTKVNLPEPEPVVRGKARKQLNGWTCEQCKNFYGQMKLSPEELKKRLDECSKHRYKYRPIEETLPGFWDLSIALEKSPEKKTT